ncbi:DUF5677 domain-containing protein [Pseudomonas mohnii]
MTEEEYIEIINSIKNEDVAGIMFEALLKLHDQLELRQHAMTEADRWIYCLFKAFFKMYNTIYHLSNEIPYFFRPHIKYIDIRSINTQIRSCHEIYLTYNYITATIIADGGIEERELKYNAYRLAGALDNKRIYNRIKNFDGYRERYDNEIIRIDSEIRECRQAISKNSVYKLLDENIKSAVQKGHWKVTKSTKLGWSDLLDGTPMPRTYGEFEYNILSLYTHSSHASLELEAQHDYDMICALAHLYKLTALMCMTTTIAFKLTELDKRTRALINDLAVMGNSIVAKAEGIRNAQQETSNQDAT